MRLSCSSPTSSIGLALVPGHRPLGSASGSESNCLTLTICKDDTSDTSDTSDRLDLSSVYLLLSCFIFGKMGEIHSRYALC